MTSRTCERWPRKRRPRAARQSGPTSTQWTWSASRTWWTTRIPVESSHGRHRSAASSRRCRKCRRGCPSCPGSYRFASLRLFHRQTRDRLENTFDLLDVFDDQRTDRVDIWGLAHGDDVVLAGDRIGRGDAFDTLHPLGDLDRPPGRRVDQDISLHPSIPKSGLSNTVSA